MRGNPFGHVDLRVNDAQKALAFYSKLLPELGFTRTFHGGGWHVFAAEGELPQAAYFAFTEKPGHVPNANRIAFSVSSREEVDRIAQVVREAGGAEIDDGPAPQPYSGTYYAVYFNDPSGNRLEVYHRLN